MQDDQSGSHRAAPPRFQSVEQERSVSDGSNGSDDDSGDRECQSFGNEQSTDFRGTESDSAQGADFAQALTDA